MAIEISLFPQANQSQGGVRSLRARGATLTRGRCAACLIRIKEIRTATWNSWMLPADELSQ